MVFWIIVCFIPTCPKYDICFLGMLFYDWTIQILKVNYRLMQSVPSQSEELGKLEFSEWVMYSLQFIQWGQWILNFMCVGGHFIFIIDSRILVTNMECNWCWHDLFVLVMLLVRYWWGLNLAYDLLILTWKKGMVEVVDSCCDHKVRFLALCSLSSLLG